MIVPPPTWHTIAKRMAIMWDSTVAKNMCIHQGLSAHWTITQNRHSEEYRMQVRSVICSVYSAVAHCIHAALCYHILESCQGTQKWQKSKVYEKSKSVTEVLTLDPQCFSLIGTIKCMQSECRTIVLQGQSYVSHCSCTAEEPPLQHLYLNVLAVLDTTACIQTYQHMLWNLHIARWSTICDINLLEIMASFWEAFLAKGSSVVHSPLYIEYNTVGRSIASIYNLSGIFMQP